MIPRFSSRIRLGLIAFGVLAGLSAPAAATPLAGASRAAAASTDTAGPASDIVQIRHRERCRGNRCGNRHWHRSQRHRHWNQHRWRHGGHYRHGPRYYRGPGWGSGIYLGVPAYRYVPPRRHYRLSAAHVSWCYDRYRSYREWDNTFQPYHGPRRQCHSPYR